jgi:hypothetical protein
MPYLSSGNISRTETRVSVAWYARTMTTEWSAVTLTKRVHLRRAMNDPMLDEAIVRAAIVSLAEYATRESIGRCKGDPVFEHVTEKRQSCWVANGKVRCYSGCGDLVHFVFFNASGAYDYHDTPKTRSALSWLNRTEAFGWKVGANVSKIVFGTPRGCWTMHRKGGSFLAKPGDAIVIGEGGTEHTAIVRSFDPNTGTLVTLDYGQFFSPAPRKPADHGGKQITRTVRKGPDGRLWAFVTVPPGRPLLGHLDALKTLQAADDAGGAPCLLPALVPSCFELGIFDDNPYI